MRRIEIKTYNGSYQNRGVLGRIRRKIEGSIRHGECVLLDGEGVIGLTEEDLRFLIQDLPVEKLRVAGFPSIWPASVSETVHDQQKSSR